MTSLDFITSLPEWLSGALPIGVIITDADLRVLHWCPWMEQHSGVAAGELMGAMLLERFPDLRARGVEAHFRRALAGEAIELGPPQHSYILQLPTQGNGSPFTHMQQRAMLSPLRANGRVVGTICAIADTTPQAAAAEEARRARAEAEEARRALAEAEDALRMRDSFFSLAAHELRTPLTALLGRAQLLQKWLDREGTGDDRSTRSAGIVVTQARRLDAMITSLLEVSRILSGRITLTPAPVDLAGLVERVVNESRAISSAHHLRLELLNAPLAVSADAPRLEHVLHQLLGNAVKYSPGGGEVLVRVRRQGDEAVVEVTDRGIGIREDEREVVFKGFHRGENAKALGSGGLGVGLFVARKIVELHGGHIAVESYEGRGSTFRVHLPLAPQ